MTNKPKIIRVPLEHLLPHPENPNRMSKANFEKLKLHIKRTGNYEPLIVRAHPEHEYFFQIINGHHRCEALKQIGTKTADCIQWDADDEQVRILLTTLNRLGGKDELSMKIEIIKKLSEKYNAKELAKLLPATKQVIEKLKDIMKPLQNFTADPKAYLQTLIFFLNDEQMQTVQAAISKAMPANGTKAEKSAAALTRIVNEWMNK
jgi:ParB-like chromosome segregation protein Spo0J